MDCARATLATFTQNDKRLRGQAGALVVLHTYSCRREFHTHVHLATPGVALDADGPMWRSLRVHGTQDGKPAFLFRQQALALVFRARLLAAIGLLGLETPPISPERWVVDCKAVGSGHPMMVYLGLRAGPGGGNGHARAANAEVPLLRRDDAHRPPAHQERRWCRAAT